MAQIPDYPQGRLSAPVADLASREGHHPAQTDYPLIQKLRSIREQGDTDLSAVESYDPDFSVKLSATRSPDEARLLLEQWLHHRSVVLQTIHDRLFEAWQSAQEDRPADA